MSPTSRRRTALASIIGLLAGVLSIFATPTPAGAETYGMTCNLPPTLSPNPFQLFPDISATVPATVNDLPGANIAMTGVTADIVVPDLIVNAGVGLGILPPGGTLSGNLTVGLEGTNVTPATQSASATGIPLGTVTGTFDPGPDGILADDPFTPTIDESADSIIIADPIISTITIPGTVNWTPTGGSPAEFRATLLSIVATLPRLIVPIWCTPGYTDPGPDGILVDDPATPADEAADNGAFIPQTQSLASTSVVVPSPIPDAMDDSATVGALQGITINVVGNDTDINGDLDPASVAVDTPPTAGTAVANGDGTITYTNTDALATSDSFTYTVNDLAGSGTDTATVNITVLGNQCDATTAQCSLSQVVDVEVIGSTLTMSQTGQFLSLSDITLNGEAQTATGSLNDIQVINARGTDPGWAVNATATDWILGGSGLSDCSTPSNKCIPKQNLNWLPTAAVGHTQLPGDVADVTAGTDVGDFSATRNLCETAATTSGGTFDCDAALELGVPASAAAGNYVATITLTLA